MQFFFSFFLLMCVQAQPSGTRHDGVSHPTATHQAVTWLQWGGGSNAGSNTSLHDTQPPDSDTTSSVVAMRAAAHCCTQPPDSDTTGSVAAATMRAAHRGLTRSHSMATRWAARRRWQ